MASQMVDARVLRTSVEISAKAPGGETAVLTASGKAIEFAGFRRAYVEGSDDPAAELEEQEAILPQCQVGDQIHARVGALSERRDRAARHRAEAPRDVASCAIHRGVAHQGAGAAWYRAAVHLRADHRDDRPSRIRLPAGQGAGSQLHGLRRDEAAARPLRRLRGNRFHRGDGRGPRRNLARRARVGRVPEGSSISAPRSIAGCCLPPRRAPRRRTIRCWISESIRRAGKPSACASDASVRSSRLAKAGPAGRHRCRTTWRRPICRSRRRWSWCAPRRKGRARLAPIRRPARTST